jgi:predicted nucleic acid-binding protein
MATRINPGEVAFLDTSYALALSAPSDQFHERATHLADELEAANARLLTTRAVLLEIGNALARPRYRAAAVALLDSLENDPTVEILPLSGELYDRARSLFRSRMDKEWGLIDCISFVVMSDRHIAKALTADEHFQQCGFRALLREVAG